MIPRIFGKPESSYIPQGVLVECLRELEGVMAKRRPTSLLLWTFRKDGGVRASETGEGWWLVVKVAKLQFLF